MIACMQPFRSWRAMHGIKQKVTAAEAAGQADLNSRHRSACGEQALQ